MVTINFLPWRRLTAEYEHRVIKKIMIFTTVIIILILAVLHIYLTNKIAGVNSQIENINNQLNQIPKPIQLHSFNDHHEANLESSSYIITTTNLLNLLLERANASVCFTEIEHSKNIYSFNGFTNSAHDLLVFIRQWPILKLFSEIHIKELQTQNNHMKFRLQAMQK